MHGMKDLPLHLSDGKTAVFLVPKSVQMLGDRAELHQEIAGQVFPLDLAAFLPPEAEQGGLIVAHDDASVGAAYERATICDHLSISEVKFEWNWTQRAGCC
jgi:hypothetical protein